MDKTRDGSGAPDRITERYKRDRGSSAAGTTNDELGQVVERGAVPAEGLRVLAGQPLTGPSTVLAPEVRPHDPGHAQAEAAHPVLTLLLVPDDLVRRSRGDPAVLAALVLDASVELEDVSPDPEVAPGLTSPVGDAELEVWAAHKQAKALEEALERKVRIEKVPYRKASAPSVALVKNRPVS